MAGKTWNRELKLSLWQKMGAQLIRLGPIPRHIAFIMDGNRRYAKQTNIATIKGHEQGFEKLIDCYTIGRSFGVSEITMYALSIENLKRSEVELNGLWALMEEKLKRLQEEIPEMIKAKATLKIIGNISLIPKHLQKLVANLAIEMEKIREPEFTCYLAIAYTSREEITQSMRTILEEVENGTIEVNDIDEDLVQKCLYTSVCKYPVDLLIRTSGETRLSDFMLWQSSDAVLYFTDVLWPEFTFWELFKAICKYQQFSVNHASKKMDSSSAPQDPLLDALTKPLARVDSFLMNNEERCRNKLLQYSQMQC